MTWLDLGKSVLSASITAGFVSFFTNQWALLRQNRRTHVREQLENFYGPVVFLIRTNEAILQHHHKLSQYADENLGETARINWQDEEQVKRNSAAIDLMIVFQNKFGDKIKNHNMQIVGLIRGNYHLIDAEDHMVCQNLVLNVVRLEIENDQTGRLREFQQQNAILIVATDFVEAILASYNGKQVELVKLSTWPLSCTRRRRLKLLQTGKAPVLTAGLKTKG